METLKEKTAKGLFWGMMNNGTMQLLNIVLGIFLARLLSPADYGLVGMLAIFTAIASALQESGFTAALANKRAPTDNEYNAVFWFSALVSLSLYALLFLCAPLIAAFYRQPELTALARMVFLTLPVSALGTAPTAWLFKRMAVRETTLLRVSSLLVSGVVGITLALRGHAYWSLAWQQLTYVTLTSVGRFFLISWRPSLRVDFKPVREMFAFSYKILITTIVNTLSQNVLTVIFGRLFPAKTVGNFSQAFKWDTMASSFISGTVAQVAQPVLVEIRDDRARQAHVFRKMLRFTAFLSFPAMFGLAMVSHEFILVTITDKWIDSVPLLRVLCVGGAFLPFYTMYQNLVISRGRSDIYMWCTLALIAAQIVSVLLTAHYGVMVMVAVYTLLTVLWLLAWHWFAHRLIGLRLLDVLRDLLPFCLLSLAVMAFTYWITRPIHSLPLLLLARVLLAAILYLGALKLLHAQVLEECLAFVKRKRGKA